MSRLAPVDFTCPYCNLEQTQDMYSSLNTETPDALKLILSNEVNLVNCTWCNERFQVLTPLLFNNIKHEYAAYYSPDGFEEIDASNIKIKETLGEDHYLTRPFKFDDWDMFQAFLTEAEWRIKNIW